ncbi:MAG: dehydrogenase, partial [Opitutia bacterium]
VRSQMASSARRLTTSQALALVGRLVRRDEDAKDRYIPLLQWWAIESHISLDREAVLGFLQDGALWDRPVMQEHLLPRLMRRFATEGLRADLLVCARLLGLAPSAAHTAHLMKGFEEAYRGREMSGLPDELLKALAASGRAPLVLRVRQGEAAAIAESLGILRNPKSKPEDRILQARLFGEVRHPDAPALLLSIATADPSVPLRKASLISLMAYDDPAIGPKAVAMLSAPKLDVEVRTAVLALLASRAPWSADLLRAVESGSVAASVVPADIVDRMRGHASDDVKALVARMYPAPAPAASADWNAKIADVEKRLKAGTGNPYAGEATFMERCASCHRLFFKGGRIGPDLTAYQRDNLGTMLISIVNPNAEIREGFQYFSVQTADGRSLSGFLVERDSQILVLRGLEGEDITLRQADVKALVPVGRSLMPEGLLEGLSDQQLRDLFAYLRISQPITK